jgi:putative membrane protein
MVTMMYGNGFGWGWMMLMPLLWIVLIGVIVWAAVMVARRPADRPAEQPRRETPQEILDRRFASGEIDAEAYSRARDQLAGRPRPS